MPHCGPSSESARIWRERGLREALGADAAAREALDRLALLAARTLRAPVGQVTLLSNDRQLAVISSGPGAWSGQRQLPLDDAYCRHVVDRGEPLVVQDAQTDPLVRDLPATTAPGIGAYAAVPLRATEGFVVGALCVIDFAPRAWSAEDVEMLDTLAVFVVAEFERPGRDVAGRMEAMQALAESESRFRQLAENVDAVFWLRDSQTRELLYVSPAYERIWGRSPDAFGAHRRAWAETIPEADRERVLRAMDANVSGEYDVEYRIVRPDGEERWVHDRGFPVHGPDGEIIRLAGIVDDVTERRLALETKAHSEARCRALIEHSAEIISVVAVDGTIGYASPAIERVLGYTPAEVQDVSFFRFIHPDDETLAQATFARLLDDGQPVSAEFRCRHRNGEYRVLSVTATLLLDDPDVQGIVVNSRDVTELREREARLRQVQRLEAVGRLAGGIAHDFNNVLTVVKASASMALTDLPADTPVRADLHEISEATERGARLTRQLLAFSRQQMLKPRLLDLNEIVAEMGAMLRRTLGPDVELVTRLEPRLGRVMADPGQVEQILMNLALNARDAMREGGRVTARTANVELDEADGLRFGFSVESGAYVCLTIEDTGTGIAEAVRERVFEPYFTTKTRGKGTGLGLATVYGIVKQSGGYILMRSREGRGTGFEIYLPRVEAEHAAPQPGPAAAAARREPTVLLVEDEPTVRALARRALARAGYRVLEAEDGEAGLRVADGHEGAIDLLLTDVMMPRMGGRELAERLTAAVPGLRVLYTSGYAEEAAMRDGGLSGAEFLQKPYGPAELVAKARQVLDRRGDPR